MQELVLRIKIDRDFDSFNEFEGFFIGRVRDLMLERIEGYLEELDSQVKGSFKAEHPEYVCYGKVRRKLRCYFGEVWISRSRYRCRGKRDVYPLDSYLPEGGVSQFIEELALDLVTEIPYERSSRLLRQFTRTKLSGKGLWHRVQKRGKQERDKVEAERHRIFEEGRDEYSQDSRPLEEGMDRAPFFVEIDGTMVSSREEESERFEIKTGVMYRDVRKTGKRRRRLMDKVVYSAVEDGDTFGEQFYGVCRRNGLDTRCGVEYISDGAGWLRTIAEDVYPEADKRLDLYHLKKACLSILTDEEWKTLEDVLYEGDVEAFVDTLEVIVAGKDITAKEKVGLLSYVLANRDSLDYGEGKRNGSGAVEKNIGIHVGRRLKKQGMSWSRRGANNLLALRTKKLNMLWNSESVRRYSLIDQLGSKN